jgi:hypothetical protein
MRASTPVLLGEREGEEDNGSGGRSPSAGQEEQVEEEVVEGGEGDPFQESVIRFHLAMTDAQLAASDPAAQQAALRRVFEELGAMRVELYVGQGAGQQEEQQQRDEAAVQQEMLADCERKAGEVMLNLLRRATSAVSPDPAAAPGLFYECVRLRQEAKVSECIVCPAQPPVRGGRGRASAALLRIFI